MGRGSALAPSGHPSGAGQNRAPRRNCAPATRFRLSFTAQHVILALNQQHEDTLAVDHLLLLHWLLAAERKICYFTLSLDESY